MVLVAVWVSALAVIASVDVSVTTSKGEVVEGKISLKSFKMTTEFGSAVIDADKVVQIQFGDPDVVVTTADVELRGKISLRSLKVVTASGARTLKRSDLASLAVVEGGRPRGVADFTGGWSGSFGPMQLKQRGTRVTGTYGFDDESKIEGTVKGRVLEIEYDSSGGNGSATLELWEDGKTFTGNYKAPGGSEGFWGGYLMQHRLAKPTPGEVTEGQTESYLNYYLRVPKDYDGKKSYPAIAFFHGSNMSSRGYVETIAAVWPKLAEDYILLGFDGERLSSGARPGRRVFNATYVNFSGHEVWHKWAYRQTPALAAEAFDELKEALPITHYFVGGHSQGGFLTYAIHMFYPDKIAGSFPMSCNLLVQCEPDRFDDKKVRAAQRQAPIAAVHGRADSVVAFSSGEYCHQRMVDGGFPVKLFAPQRVGHGFNSLPVEEAVRWLEVMVSEDPDRLVDFAEDAARNKEWRDAATAALRAKRLDPKGATAEKLAKALAKVDDAASGAAARLEKAIKAHKDNGWVDDFWDFREEFAFAPVAQGTMQAYARLREKHAEKANELFNAARGKRDETERNELYGELLEKYYASKWWKLVQSWVN